MHVCICAYECGWLRNPEESVRSIGARVLGGCGPPSMSAGTKLLSFSREAGALNPRAISQALVFFFMCVPTFLV